MHICISTMVEIGRSIDKNLVDPWLVRSSAQVFCAMQYNREFCRSMYSVPSHLNNKHPNNFRTWTAMLYLITDE